MKLKQQVNFEWSVGDDEFGSPLLVNPLTPRTATLPLPRTQAQYTSAYGLSHTQQWASSLPVEPTQLLHDGEAKFLWQRARDLFLLALAAILMSSMPFTPDQIEQWRAEEGVAAALESEYQAWRQKDRDHFTTLLDLPAAERWQWEWRDYWSLSAAEFADLALDLRRVDRQGEIVRVEAVVNRPSTKWWRSSPYRETRFYRETDSGWLRTLPPDSYWGPIQATETEHLRFEYRAHDAPVVEPQVARLQSVYLELCALLELPPEVQYKWTYILVPDRTDGRTGYFNRTQYTSPVLSEVPDMLSDEEYVAQMIVSTMASRAVYGASPIRRSYLHRWEMLVWSLYGCGADCSTSVRLACPSPGDLRESLASRISLTLSDVEHWPESNRPAQERVMRQYMVSESIIDFVVTTYGRDKLPALIKGMERDRDWESLTTNVYGKSAVEFETAWNRYLAATYLDQTD
ncbi:MAG: hypothetical protein R3E79_19600 [Caldilineaceae bacterium]